MQHSVTHKPYKTDDRLFSPAATHNAGPICQALAPFLPATGTALEIASGTGEHVVKLAKLSPSILWQPTDIDGDRLKSIAAWIVHTGLTNILPPVLFNAVDRPWPGKPMDVVFLSNLTHLLSQSQTQTLLANMAQACVPGSILAIYGPFKRGQVFASAGDEAFDASIRAQRPDAGYKDIGWVESCLAREGLTPKQTIAMPANNLITLWTALP